jgi:PGF-CTERM protein
MTHTTRVGVGLLCLLAITGVAVGQSAAFTFTTTASEAQAGSDVTVTFTYENTGDSTQTAVVNVTSTPDGWEITDRSNDGGQWNSGDQSWLYLSVSPGSSVTPSLTLSVPADAGGAYDVAAMAADDSNTVQSAVTFEFGTDGEPTTETATDGTETMATETAADAGTETATDEPTTDEPATTGGSGPGFGVVATALAALSLGLLARRRR